MNLRTQLNLAFTTLLIVILTITGFVIYSLILNMLIEKEETELRQKGEILIEILNSDYRSSQSAQEFQEFLTSQEGDLILYNRRENAVLFSTMPIEYTQKFYQEGYFQQYEEELWEGGGHKFITERIAQYPNRTGIELILLTPLNDLQEVQQSFLSRLLVVFIIGGILAAILSYYLTHRLITPLTLLKKELKKVEKRQFDQLERVKATGELKEVEQSLFEMANELERYMKSQQTFFQNASHELKTPLMTVQGYAEGIKEGIFDQEERDQGLETMVEEISRLKKIINEMILLAKLESQETEFNIQSIDSHDFIKRVYNRVLPLAEQDGVELNVKEEVRFYIQTDEEKLLQAVLNIAINAVRHAKFKVKINVTQQTISIEDDGEGIPENLIPYIFNRFVKGKGGETGLGLAIARSIIEQSSGNLNVEDSDIGGARFVIKFNI